MELLSAELALHGVVGFVAGRLARDLLADFFLSCSISPVRDLTGIVFFEDCGS